MKRKAMELLSLSQGKRIDLIHFTNFEKMDCYVTFNDTHDVEKCI